MTRYTKKQTTRHTTRYTTKHSTYQPDSEKDSYEHEHTTQNPLTCRPYSGEDNSEEYTLSPTKYTTRQKTKHTTLYTTKHSTYKPDSGEEPNEYTTATYTTTLAVYRKRRHL
jgi:hypothetical protein